jgi:hypothetical protein
MVLQLRCGSLKTHVEVGIFLMYLIMKGLVIVVI